MVAFSHVLVPPPSPLVPLSAEGRRSLLLAYDRWLARRNGAVDQRAHTSPVRDAFFAELAANRPTMKSRLDAGVFERNQRPGGLESDLDARSLWAVCTANVNACEAWGVEQSIAMHDAAVARGEAGQNGALDATYGTILVEEQYHTRMLGEAVAALGLTMQRYTPPITDRIVVRGILHLPRGLSDCVTLMSELAGVAAFRLLHAKARELFADEPEVLEQIESVYEEIELDEIGHVRFLQARIGAIGLGICRVFTAPVCAMYLAGMPEVVRLCGWRRIMDEVARVASGEALCSLDGGEHPVNTAAAAALYGGQSAHELFAG
jgi:hypothetical protein